MTDAAAFLPMATAARALVGSDPVAASIGFPFGEVPDAALTLARTSLGLEIIGSAIDATSSPSFRLVVARLRAEQVVRGLSFATNLLLAGKVVVVVGTGELAFALVRVLARVGARVTLASEQPEARLAVHLDGLSTWPDVGALPPADFVFATAEGHAPLQRSAIRGEAPLVLDAALGSATGIRAGFAAIEGGERVRASVRRFDGPLFVVDPPLEFALQAGQLSPLGWRMADAALALALLASVDSGAVSAATDARLAELVIT